MVTKDTLLQVIYEQRIVSSEDIIPRKIDMGLVSAPEILVITGVRRCGKSTLLRQIQQQLSERDYYINFDDERLLNFEVNDFQQLNELFHSEFGEQHTYYFDEIQNVKGWERFVDRLYNTGNKVFVTGSNANLLSRELGTLLTGRHLTLELYPFSFAEFLIFRRYTYRRQDFHTTEGRARLGRYFSEYLAMGGMPQYLRAGNTAFLKSLYTDIVFRDVIVRNGITAQASLREMIYYLASNVTHPFTFNSVAKSIGMKSMETVSNWIFCLEQTYMVHCLNKYDSKVGVQLRSPKKLYFIDNALAGQVGFNLSKNQGLWLENAVAIELQRRGADFYYHSNGHECDFVVRQGHTVTQAIQVSAVMDQPDTRKRELDGIAAAMTAYGLELGLVITLDRRETVHDADGRRVEIMPCWLWMLEESRN
jgi:predicted AAA+ superfamily ATPase